MSQTPVVGPSKTCAANQHVCSRPNSISSSTHQQQQQQQQHQQHPHVMADDFDPLIEIELNTLGDAVDEEIDTEPQSLLSPGGGRSDDTQVLDAAAESPCQGSAPWQKRAKNNAAIDIPDFSSMRTRPIVGALLSTRHRSQSSSDNWTCSATLLTATFVIVIILVLILSLALPSSTPNGHNGDTVIQGGCNDRTRCDKSALCVTLSPSTYTCSCPSWLIGSGFDDDPCICQQSVLSVPDFSHNVCVTKGSHFTLAGLVCFIVGMSILFVFGCAGLLVGMPHALGLCILLVLLGAAGMMTPKPSSICGQSSYGARVCETGTNCVDGTCVQCPQGQFWSERDGTCLVGGSGRCTPQTCNNVPNSTCLEGGSGRSGYNYACATNGSPGRPPSSSAIASAPTMTLTLIMAIMLLV